MSSAWWATARACGSTAAGGRRAGTNIFVESRPFDDPDVVALVAQVQDYYRDLYGGPDRDRVDPDDFTPPAGLFLVGYRDGVPVACGGWRRLDERTAELKRMFVVPAARRAGLGRVLLRALEDTARSAGVEVMVLNTGWRQADAIALYASGGYRQTDERFGHYREIRGANFYRRALT